MQTDKTSKGLRESEEERGEPQRIKFLCHGTGVTATQTLTTVIKRHECDARILPATPDLRCELDLLCFSVSLCLLLLRDDIELLINSTISREACNSSLSMPKAASVYIRWGPNFVGVASVREGSGMLPRGYPWRSRNLTRLASLLRGRACICNSRSQLEAGLRCRTKGAPDGFQIISGSVPDGVISGSALRGGGALF